MYFECFTNNGKPYMRLVQSVWVTNHSGKKIPQKQVVSISGLWSALMTDSLAMWSSSKNLLNPASHWSPSLLRTARAQIPHTTIISIYMEDISSSWGSIPIYGLKWPWSEADTKCYQDQPACQAVPPSKTKTYQNGNQRFHVRHK